MTLTIENLIQSLSDQLGLSKQQSKALVEALFGHIKKSMESGEDVLISGFGKFSVRTKAPRRGRNPKATGSNSVPATKNIKDLHRFGVGSFSLMGYFWALFLRLITFEALVKSLKSRHSREGGSPEALEKTGFPPTRE